MPDRRRIERTRTFVAIKIPDHLKKELAKIQQHLGDQTDALRFIKPDELHITLSFLGNCSAEVQNIVISLCQRIIPTFQPFDLHSAQLGAFPRMNRPAVIWVGLSGDTETLSKLVYAIEDAFKARSILPLSHRSDFIPHISIGMVSQKERRGNLRSIRELIEETTISLSDIHIPVKEVVVYRGNPQSHGLKYQPLKIVPLTRSFS